MDKTCYFTTENVLKKKTITSFLVNVNLWVHWIKSCTCSLLNVTKIQRTRMYPSLFRIPSVNRSTYPQFLTKHGLPSSSGLQQFLRMNPSRHGRKHRLWNTSRQRCFLLYHTWCMSGLQRKWSRRRRTGQTQEQQTPPSEPNTHHLHSKQRYQRGSPDVIQDSGGCERGGLEMQHVNAPPVERSVFLLWS